MGGFILTKPREDRLPHDALIGPALEGHFADQLRFYPGNRGIGLRYFLKRAFLPDQRVQPFADFPERLRTESTSRMTDEDQFVSLENAQDQGAEMSPAPSRFRESRDHAFLRELGLHLQPLPAPPAHPVGALRMLGDDPFEPLFLDDLEKEDALFPDVIAESYYLEKMEGFFSGALFS